VRLPFVRHPVVSVVAGIVLVGSGLLLTLVPPRADAPDLPPPAAAESPAPAPPRPAPLPGPLAAPAPTAVTLPGTPHPVPLVPVGVLPNRALELPDRPSVLGWYAAGAVPGEPGGTVVVAGHVDSAEFGAGPLRGLLDLRTGDPVEVTDAAGGTHRYAVASRTTYRKADLPTELFRPDGPPQLALVTCGGAFDRRTGQYADNVVVIAAPLPAGER
jgi:Sortase domain